MAERGTKVAGYFFALGAGALWGTTGPLSTALYGEGAALTSVGFWRILLATLGFLLFGIARPELFRIDRKGLLLVGGAGGTLVAFFEVPYQFAIAGVGVAGAATLLYTAPLMVAVLARPLLRERLTPLRVLLAVVVLLGVALTVTGHIEAGEQSEAQLATSQLVGVIGGLLAALSYACTTLLARWAVPRYGAMKVLFYEIAGGTILLATFLPLSGNTPQPADSAAGWLYVLALGLGSVLLANFAFFAALRRIDAAPTAVAASIEPIVGALLALLLFQQGLTALGWLGLVLVVGGVALGYARETEEPLRLAEP